MTRDTTLPPTLRQNGTMKKNYSEADIAQHTPDQLIAQAQSLLVIAEQKKAEAHKASEAKRLAKRDDNEKALVTAHKELGKVEQRLGVLARATPFSSNDVAQIDADIEEATDRKTELEISIKTLQADLGYAPKLAGLPQVAPPKVVIDRKNWAVIVGIVAAIVLGFVGIVMKTGIMIKENYPQAVAVYNETSFQKVAFAFVVLFIGLVSAIAALSLFFPAIARYLNPFARHELDFVHDFSENTPWQRNVLSVVLFSVFLLAFILIVAGKLD